jgi:curved DNA-binding protein CbpA
MNPQEAREILGVDKDSTEGEIRERYKELVQKNHPDKGGSSRLFKQIKEAHDVLINPSISEEPKTDTNNSRSKSPRNSQSRDREFDPENTYDLYTISNIEISKMVEQSLGRIVTENRLTEQTPGITHPQTLTDKPLIEYIHKKEQPHFTLRFTKLTGPDGTIAPENGGFLVLTDVRILIIIGFAEGDEEITIPYGVITGVHSRGAIFSHRHKFTLEADKEYRFKIDHNPTGESEVRNQDELDLEIENAEQFVREAAYQAMQS